jgi:hypothetical protein
LKGGASCAIIVIFTPVHRGSQNATLTVKSAAGSNQVSLSGQGT